MNFEEFKEPVKFKDKYYNVGVLVGSQEFDDEDAVGYYIEGYGISQKGDIVLFRDLNDVVNYHKYTNEHIRESWIFSPFVHFHYLEHMLKTSLTIGVHWIKSKNMFAFVNNKKCEIQNVRVDDRLQAIILEVEDEFEL